MGKFGACAGIEGDGDVEAIISSSDHQGEREEGAAVWRV